MFLSYIIAIILIMLLSALYSAAETSITSLSQPLLHKLKEEGNKKAILICELREKKDMLLSSLLIASSALDTIGSAVAISMAVEIGGVAMIPIATIIMTLVVILFADIIPKTFAFEYPKKTAFFTAYFIKYSVFVFYPFTKLIQFLVMIIFKVLRINPSKRAREDETSDMLRGAIAMGQSLGYLPKEDKQMLDGILDLSSCKIKDVMTPISEMCSTNISISAEEMLSEMLSTGHSRFPVWDEKQENIIGVIYIKDLFHLIQKNQNIGRKKIEKLLIHPWFVSENNILSTQLKEFRKRKIHFSIVVNERDIPVGIVSLEDVLEEIVGSIYDEHDALKESIQKIGRGWYMVKASVKIKEINRYLGWDLHAPKTLTIGNLLQKECSTMPEVGKIVKCKDLIMEVVKLSKGKIQQVKIKKA